MINATMTITRERLDGLYTALLGADLDCAELPGSPDAADLLLSLVRDLTRVGPAAFDARVAALDFLDEVDA